MMLETRANTLLSHLPASYSCLLLLSALPALGLVSGCGGTRSNAPDGRTALDAASSPDGAAVSDASATDASLSDAGSVEGWRPFADTSPWNTPIPSDVALRPDSDALIEHLISSTPPAWRRLGINIRPWSIPVFWADSSTPTVTVRTPLSNEGQNLTLTWPIPEDAAPDPQTDGHLTIVDRTSGRGYDFFQGRRVGDRWDCTLCSTIDLNGDGVRPPKGGTRPWYESHGSRACGFPLIAGLITVDEVRRGRIDHALVIAYPGLRQRWFRSPASTGHPANGRISEDQGVPCGGRVQLDPSVDVTSLGLSAEGVVVARALQEYGAYVGDYSDSTNLYADGSASALTAWATGLTTDTLSAIDLRSLRVIEWGELTPDG